MFGAEQHDPFLLNLDLQAASATAIDRLLGRLHKGFERLSCSLLLGLAQRNAACLGIDDTQAHLTVILV